MKKLIYNRVKILKDLGIIHDRINSHNKSYIAFLSHYIKNYEKNKNIIDGLICEYTSGTNLKEKLYRYLINDNNEYICKEETCNNKVKFLSISKGFRDFCSVKCSNTYWIHHTVNPFKGKHHSEETKQKMRGKRPQISGENNPFRNSLINNPEKRKQFSQKLKLAWKNKSPEWMKKHREKLSKSMAKSHKFNHNKFVKNHKSEFLYYYGELMFFRSSYEVALANLLNNNKFVDYFQIEPFAVEYFDFEKNIYRYTRLDFLVIFNNGKRVIFEVKPNGLLNTYKYKVIGVVEYSILNEYEFYIITEDIIFNKSSFDVFIEKIYFGYIKDWYKILDLNIERYKIW